ncbi:MAG: transposase, partial [Verrucomicrobia bacterium]|nr:transposase [Verrucomicrobiota bacterium]
EELLLVLDRPDIPLHNNLSERDIREYVKKRKISGSTRSDNGRQCRDTFTSLKKTCRKLGVSFWDYLNDRVSNAAEIPPLPDLIRVRARSA